MTNFQGGRLKYFLPFWKTICHDTNIHAMISGMKIDLINDVQQTNRPREIKCNAMEYALIQGEITNFLNKGIIKRVYDSDPDEFISNIFTRPKKDGGVRVILNLRQFNKNVEYHHFKMQGLQSAISLMTQNAYMASIDYRDAYFSCPIDEEHQKYLRFIFNGEMFQFMCLPNGLSSGPRNFTQIAKILFKYLKEKGHLNSNYLDDSFLCGQSYQSCLENIIDTLIVSRKAGFVVHPDKSVVKPTQIMEFLGFILNSLDMTVRLTKRKIDNLTSIISHILQKSEITIQELSEIIGKLVATFPGVQYGKLYYRQIDNEKTLALKMSKGDYSAKMKLSNTAKSDLKWWVFNLPTCKVDIPPKSPK